MKRPPSSQNQKNFTLIFFRLHQLLITRKDSIFFRGAVDKLGSRQVTGLTTQALWIVKIFIDQLRPETIRTSKHCLKLITSDGCCCAGTPRILCA